MVAPETSDAVARVQAALVAVGFRMPTTDIDGIFSVDGETGAAISAYKADRGLVPNDPVVGVGTANALDAEIRFLEDDSLAFVPDKPGTLALDPYKAGRAELALFEPSIGQKVLDLFELRDRICFRLSMELGPIIAQWFGETIVEPRVFKDFRALMAPSGPSDFRRLKFDPSELPRHAASAPVAGTGLAPAGRRQPHTAARRRRRSTRSNRQRGGARDATLKLISILNDYTSAGLPYVPTLLPPTREIPSPDVGPDGGDLQPVLELRRPGAWADLLDAVSR